MPRVTGRALDPETGNPIAGRMVAATLEPAGFDASVLPMVNPPGKETVLTATDGTWELNLRQTFGFAAYYRIRVWLNGTAYCDVPAGEGPFALADITIERPPIDDEQIPPTWEVPPYVRRSEMGQPHGVATLNELGVLSVGERPPSTGGGDTGPLSDTYTQLEPSTVWLATHDLSFRPSGIVVYDHLGARHFPDEITWPSDTAIQLSFSESIRGTVHLS